MLYAEGYLYIIHTNDASQEDEVQKRRVPSRQPYTWGLGTRGGTGRRRTSKNHTFFIFGWCAAEMRRIIDVSCFPGAGSYN